MTDDHSRLFRDATPELQRELNEGAALVLWCFLWEQAALVQAHLGAAGPENRPVHWRHVLTFLMGMLEQGPAAQGLLEYAESCPKLAAEIARGEVDWKGLVEELRDGDVPRA
jgi:hypothetical protein